MLFMGQELLETKQFADDSPLDWSRKTNYAGIVQFYRDMIHVRRNLDGVSRGMTGPNMTWHAVDNSAKLLAFHRWGAGPDDHVMMVLNFSNSEIANYQINSFPANGTWYVNLNSDWPAYSSDFGNKGSSLVQVSNGSGQITVGPYSVLVLSRRALPYLDSDGDGLLNGWEEQHFGDPISGVATADDDLDGVDNLAEQAADTDPHSADSVLKITDIRVENGNVVLSWKGGQSVRQILKRAGQLTGTWTALYTNQPPTAISNSVTIPGPISSSTFFRIETAR
jgi:1,4-alpha-glucan branching enzyme